MKFNDDELHKFMDKYTKYNPSTYFYTYNSSTSTSGSLENTISS